MPEVLMPRLSDSMEEGTILRWLKSDGDEIRPGDELAEIETDKATMPFEAEDAGVLRIVAGEGASVAVGGLIATIGEDAPAAAAAQTAAPSASAGAEPVPTETPAASPEPVAAGDGDGDGDDRVKASPVARRIARERGIDLATVRGSGPGGRVVRADVEHDGGAVPSASQTPAPAAPALSESGTAKGDVHIQELTRTQQTVARRMAESKAIVPEFAIQTVVDMDAAVELRAELKALADPAPSFNDMVVKAAALALRETPRANASYKDGRFELYSRVNVGIAVAAQDALIVPTIFDADRKGLATIARESRALAERVRSATITPPELSGGTFTVSNLGMYGVTEFQAIINAPQAAILAVGALTQAPVVRDGQVVAGHQLNLTLVCDHRILYGADAAGFLARIRQLLEQPLALTL